jgi:asparagine synthase (glutamine-hydrolysing)
MCGIAGKITWGKGQNDKQIRVLCDELAHRGPDAFGLKNLGEAVLGHRRLSILDLSDRAAQPMSAENGRFHIVYNGEVYNFREIRKTLEDEGVSFFSTSDTEVVLKAYVRWGSDSLKRFNGMFAFAIWDSRDRELFIARDRFGQKPLYYYVDNSGDIVFASEIKAMSKSGVIPDEISLEGINSYLALGYIPAPLTPYKEVFKLEPASWMKFGEGHRREQGVYWDFSEFFGVENKSSSDDMAEELLYNLRKSVKYRMISDVPVGAFLSGGIDSSSIVALMKKESKEEIHTFSMGFDIPSYSELDDAKRMADYLGTEHHQKICRINDGDRLLEDAINAYGEPFADTSLIPTYEVSRLAAEKVKVVLSGDGADELFAGYITYKADRYYKFAQYAPSFVKRLFAKDFGKYNNKKKINLNYKRKQFFYGLQKPSYEEAHYSWRLYFRPEERVDIMGREHRDLVYDTDPFHVFKKYYNKLNGVDPLSANLYVDCMTWLPDDILMKVDRASMAHGLEARTPFLDVHLAEFSASIPSSMKLKGNSGKHILKEAMSKILPEFVFKKKKSGFNAPVGSWLGIPRGDEFRGFNEYVIKKKLSNIDVFKFAS